MANPNVERWRQRGNVAMWRNRDSPDSRWNFSADQSGCESLENLFGLMQTAKWPSKSSIVLTSPTVTANGGGDNLRFAETVNLTFPAGRVPDDHWQLTHDEQPTITLGHQRLAEFRAAVVDIGSGNGDYTIGNETDRLWVWWWVANT